jgi:hypothetical protein
MICFVVGGLDRSNGVTLGLISGQSEVDGFMLEVVVVFLIEVVEYLLIVVVFVFVVSEYTVNQRSCPFAKAVAYIKEFSTEFVVLIPFFGRHRTKMFPITTKTKIHRKFFLNSFILPSHKNASFVKSGFSLWCDNRMLL